MNDEQKSDFKQSFQKNGTKSILPNVSLLVDEGIVNQGKRFRTVVSTPRNLIFSL
jgi:hypothetical protein